MTGAASTAALCQRAKGEALREPVRLEQGPLRREDGEGGDEVPSCVGLYKPW